MITKKKKSTLGITALIFSLGSIFLSVTTFVIVIIIMEAFPDSIYPESSMAITIIALLYIIFILFIVAIILGIISLFVKGKNKYLAIAAIIFSFLSIFLIGASWGFI
ncbi:hypothetical protein AwWohl_06890 [Gammaproteobacteria bacterium]|nr:hypothetical protein AwWohl_06890 [Gammaproteobacteria bacterium]